MEYIISAMTPADLPGVMEIENAERSGWSRKLVESELFQSTGFQFVARSGQSRRVAAFLCGRLVAGEGEILKLAVGKSMRRRGIGRLLLNHSLQWLQAKGAANCFLELRRSNTAALALYCFSGFRDCGVREKYYQDPVEDALLLRLELAAGKRN